MAGEKNSESALNLWYDVSGTVPRRSFAVRAVGAAHEAGFTKNDGWRLVLPLAQSTQSFAENQSQTANWRRPETVRRQLTNCCVRDRRPNMTDLGPRPGAKKSSPVVTNHHRGTPHGCQGRTIRSGIRLLTFCFASLSGCSNHHKERHRSGHSRSEHSSWEHIHSSFAWPDGHATCT